jgi:hypothetical protein
MSSRNQEAAASEWLRVSDVTTCLCCEEVADSLVVSERATLIESRDVEIECM